VVGLLTTAGKKVEVHVSLSQDLGKLLQAMHKIRIGGKADLLSSIQIARLALRHRQNKKQEQRIVLFVGSPVSETEEELSNLGGQLKKNKVAIDIVSFGEENAEANGNKLEALYKATNNNNNSHFVTIPPGSHMLSESIALTEVVRGDEPISNNSGGSYIDENIDPELAEALRLSLQAEEDRIARNGSQNTEENPNRSAELVGGLADEDDLEFKEALRLSMQQDGDQVNEHNDNAENNDDAGDDLEEAIRLSKQQDESTPLLTKENEMEVDKETQPVDMSDVDPEFMSSVFLQLPGIDPTDPEVMALLSGMKEKSNEKDKEDKDK
jgi:26S proteasome regulatory subunit N10